MIPNLSRPTGTIRVGVLGAGFISDYHIRPLRAVAQVEVTAVCDADRQKASACQKRWKIPQYFSSLPEMLRSGSVDVVHVLTPPSTHASAARACMESGCHVFVEKPMAVSSAECEQLKACASRSQRTLGVNHNAAFHPAVLRLLQMARNWRLGAIEHVTACVNVPLRQLWAGQHDHWIFREFGNIILEQAPHPLSQIQLLLGPVRECASTVSGLTHLETGVPFHDTWQVSLVCERGTAQLLLSFGREYMENSLHVIGQDGSAFVDLRRNTIRISEKSRFLDPVDNLRDAFRNSGTVLTQGVSSFVGYCLAFLNLRPSGDPFPLGISNSIQSFYDDLRQHRTPAMGLAEGASVIDGCERIVRSAENSLKMPGEERMNVSFA